jgi:hypothetical protein
MSVLIGKSLNKGTINQRLNDSRFSNSIEYSGKKSMWNKYAYHQSGGPLNRAYSMALNNSRMMKSHRQPGMINCIKVLVGHNHKKLITAENA